MSSPALRIALFALTATAAVAQAATPSSITLSRRGETPEGQGFEVHTVKCSDGTVKAITAWSDRTKWCQGEEGSTDCTASFIEAARAACKG